ncbi:MAG: hypothetical protein NTX56_04220 [Proteobacteria bacterium]|nr:hypothetical protein [Pseudomonadota bacterium]
MAERHYISNIALGWPVEDQVAMLAGMGPQYQDHIGPTLRKFRRASDLKKRADMLRPTTRKGGTETIHVAGFPVLAWNATDFTAVLAAAAARGATIHSVSTGLRVPPDAPAAVVAEAMAQFSKGRYRAPGLPLGREIARDKKLADTQVRLDRIRDRWPLPEPPTADLLAEAGQKRRGGVIVPMSYGLACQHLGKRPLAQKRHQQKIARAAKKDQTHD